MRNKTPHLRYKGFDNDWVQYKVDDVATRYDTLRIPVAANLRVHGDTPYYGANGIQDYVDGYTHDGEFVLVAEDGANDLKDYPVRFVNGRIWVNNHAHVLQGKNSLADNKFLTFSIKRADIESLIVGGSRAKLNAETLMEIEIFMPNVAEQIKIGNLINQIDCLIAYHQYKHEKLVDVKKSLLEKMFPAEGEPIPKIRFNCYTDTWKQCKFGEVVSTYSYRKYIAEPQETGKYIVIQQGDDPIAGYSNGIPFLNYNSVIVFGDHTLSIYMPSIPFFVASDGVKVLSADEKIRCDYFYYMLEKYKPASEGYKRHFTILKNCTAFFPTKKEEQRKIANLVHGMDNLITLQQQAIEKLNNIKKSLLERMFV